MFHLKTILWGDELVNDKKLIQTLTKFDFKTIEKVSTLHEIVNVLSKSKIDMIFSQIKNDTSVKNLYNIQKKYRIPIICISTCKDKKILQELSRVDILGYLLKPIRVDELEILIYLSLEKLNFSSLIKYKNFTYYTNSQKIIKNNEEIYLSKKEGHLIFILLTNINTNINYETIDKHIWDDNYVNDNTRRNFIYRFKKKFPEFNIKIEKGIGLGLYY